MSETATIHSIVGVPDYLVQLREIFSARMHSDPAYSLRKFAKSIGVDPSMISKILSGKKKMTFGLGLRIAEHLQFDASTKEHFLISIIEERKQDMIRRVNEITHTKENIP